MMIDLTCKHCGQPFKEYPSNLTRSGRGQFCSRLCANMAKTGKRIDPVKRFWKYVQIVHDEDSCWPWIGGKDNHGYGIFWDGARLVRAHRFSYEIAHGLLLSELNACHSCDNPPCVRPKHLFAGTDTDNRQDCLRKGRHKYGHSPNNKPPIRRGETNHNAKLTDQAVRQIRSLRGEMPQGEIAKLFSISQSLVSMIQLGQGWKHIA